MSFYRKNRNNDNYGERPFSEKEKARFIVSNKSFQSAIVVSSVVITFFVFFIFIIKTAFTISESDIQTICEVTAGLCGFALAIPLFLKDFDITSDFWKQFYLIAITFLVAAFISVIAFLQIDDTTSINVTLYLYFFLSIIISVNINTINLLWNKITSKFKVSLNPILNLSISYFALFISLIFSEGNFWIYATALFTIYGFYLTLTLMLSIFIELLFTMPQAEDNDTRIKKAIQRLAEKYKEKALDEQTLLDLLKAEEFPNEPEIISRTKIQELVVEMDTKTADIEPKISIYEYDKIIPRWTKEDESVVEKIAPKYIFLNIVNNYFCFDSYKIGKELIIKIYNQLSLNTHKSIELLKENNVLERKYEIRYMKVKYKKEINSYNNRISLTNDNYSSVYYYMYPINPDIELLDEELFLVCLVYKNATILAINDSNYFSLMAINENVIKEIKYSSASCLKIRDDESDAKLIKNGDKGYKCTENNIVYDEHTYAEKPETKIIRNTTEAIILSNSKNIAILKTKELKNNYD